MAAYLRKLRSWTAGSTCRADSNNPPVERGGAAGLSPDAQQAQDVVGPGNRFDRAVARGRQRCGGIGVTQRSAEVVSDDEPCHERACEAVSGASGIDRSDRVPRNQLAPRAVAADDPILAELKRHQPCAL